MMLVKQYLRVQRISVLSHRRNLFTDIDLKLNTLPPNEYRQLEPEPDDEIIIAMSSGVDSSVTASLYANKYKNVRGIYMANWSQTSKCLEDEWKDVQKVCNQLNIPCERVNFEKEYWTDVFLPMIDMYQNGLTPNPDIGCNRYVKFGKMIEHLHDKFKSLPTKWWLVTGHYARIMTHNESGVSHLLRGIYPYKDQSYYLSMLPHNIMNRILMPIGHMTKPQVRELAQKIGLVTAKKPDSQGLCFVSQDQRNFTDFLSEFINPMPGNYVTEDGQVVGKHKGIWQATIGQRARVCMPQGDPKYRGQWFVSEKRPSTNELVIVQGAKNPALYSSKLVINDWNSLDPNLDISKIPLSRLSLQYRSLQEEPNKINDIRMGMNGNTIEIELQESARAMAPGQYIVIYDRQRVLGAGVLQSTCK